MTQHALLEARQVQCIRQNKSLFELVTFSLKAGEALLVEGANGTGKSSLLRLLAGIATPAAGEIFWKGSLISESMLEYSEAVHYLGHQNGIKSGLTIAENLQLASQLFQHPLSNHEETLVLLKLQAYQHTQVQYLSAGQKRRVALAKIFLIPRPLWILDEPLTSLDTATQKILVTKIEAHLENGGSAILTSHQPLDWQDKTVQRLVLQPC